MNVIPEIAKATVNIRFNDFHTSQSLIEWMQNHISAIFNKDNQATCTFTFDANAESFINKEGELTKLMTKSITEVTGQNNEPEFATDGGTSDARFIKDMCPVAELGMKNATAHKIDEHVSVKDLTQLTEIYLQIIFLCSVIHK